MNELLEYTKAQCDRDARICEAMHCDYPDLLSEETKSRILDWLADDDARFNNFLHELKLLLIEANQRHVTERDLMLATSAQVADAADRVISKRGLER